MGAYMQDLWNVPDNISHTDILTARVAAGIRYTFALMKYSNGQNDALRKNVVHDLGINKDTLQVYLSPILDKQFRIVSGPTKLTIFHGILHRMGLRLSHFYAAAEDCVSKEEFIQRINLIVLTHRVDPPSLACIRKVEPNIEPSARWS